MGDFQVIEKAALSQYIDKRQQTDKETVRSVYKNNAKGILMTRPFSYPENIADDVANGIVDHCDKLVPNAIAEDDEDMELNELNNMGDKFKSISTIISLVLTVGVPPKNAVERVNENIPMPTIELHVVKETAPTLPEVITKLKDFVHYDARSSLSATVVMVGLMTEDGLELECGMTVPVPVLEDEVKKIMDDKDQILPAAVDLVFVDAESIYASTVFGGGKEEIRYKLVA